MNTQKPEPRAAGDGSTLDVHSVFPTVQGEGPLSGHPAVFVRLGGCNLRCPGCDTEYTVGRRRVGVQELFREVAQVRPPGGWLVVVTGGEPFRQPIGRFVEMLWRSGFRVQVETNGTVTPDDDFKELWRLGPHADLLIVLSPKTRSVDPWLHACASAFKYVIDHRCVSPTDGLPTVALDHEGGRGVARPRTGAPVFLTPYDTGDEVADAHNRRTMVGCSMQYGHVVNMQMHKLLGVE